MMTKFQYMSDIHTEFFNCYPGKISQLCAKLRVVAPYLVLAGDVGYPFSQTYSLFLSEMSKRFQLVFVIAGNHEYYCRGKAAKKQYRALRSGSANSWISHVNAQMRLVCQTFPNVIFLDNEIYHLKVHNEGHRDIVIFGGTMWTHIPVDMEHVTMYINDFTQIPGAFEPKTARQLFHRTVTALKHYIDSTPVDHKFIVVTHHLPSFSLISSNDKCSLVQRLCSHAYATELKDMTILDDADWSRICAWFAGHTHTSVDSGIFHVNPIGYPGENVKPDLNKVVVIVDDSSKMRKIGMRYLHVF